MLLFINIHIGQHKQNLKPAGSAISCTPHSFRCLFCLMCLLMHMPICSSEWGADSRGSALETCHGGAEWISLCQQYESAVTDESSDVPSSASTTNAAALFVSVATAAAAAEQFYNEAWIKQIIGPIRRWNAKKLQEYQGKKWKKFSPFSFAWYCRIPIAFVFLGVVAYQLTSLLRASGNHLNYIPSSPYHLHPMMPSPTPVNSSILI